MTAGGRSSCRDRHHATIEVCDVRGRTVPGAGHPSSGGHGEGRSEGSHCLRHGTPRRPDGPLIAVDLSSTAQRRRVPGCLISGWAAARAAVLACMQWEGPWRIAGPTHRGNRRSLLCPLPRSTLHACGSIAQTYRSAGRRRGNRSSWTALSGSFYCCAVIILLHEYMLVSMLLPSGVYTINCAIH